MVSHDELERGLLRLDDPPLEVDLTLAGLEHAALAALRPRLHAALAAMAALEGGARANVDEDRMVGHYWLRAPGLAPDAETGEAILADLVRVERLAADVAEGRIAPPEGGAFTKLVHVGIGGSGLGPMLLVDALGDRAGPVSRVVVIDNTDPDGIRRALNDIGSLGDALVTVVSKSGRTPETVNGLTEIAAACAAEGLALAPRAVAITGEGSALDRRAREEGWLARFAIPDWVGGRTSLWCPVGLLPAALAGVDVRGLLAGAAAMDTWTRVGDPAANPACHMAAWWYLEGRGQGERAMVVLPYADRLVLLGRYLQQLVMESLGKRLDRQGAEVCQGLTVYGNKGSTDQHAFVQQLRDGRHDFFVVFARVLGGHPGAEVRPGVHTGDYLDGFWQGTRQALAGKGRHSVTLTLADLDARGLGAMLALFERVVGLYAELIDINAYHQPGVEAGKKAAAAVLELQAKVLAALDATPRACADVADALGADCGTVWALLRHLATSRPDVQLQGLPDPAVARFVRRSSAGRMPDGTTTG